jgi:hypothetical protein
MEMPMPMRSGARLVLTVVVVAAAGPVLSACSSIPDLDSISELWDTKKPLNGERKPVFPDGVPGVTAGVPPELVRGYREPESGMVDPAKVAAEAAAEGDAKPKKPPPQRTAAAKPKPKPAADSSAQAQRQPPPAQPQPAPWTPQQQQPAWPGGR